MCQHRAGRDQSAAARVCREAGAGVTTNDMVRDLAAGAVDPRDRRMLEVVADGLPSFKALIWQWTQPCLALAS